MKAVIALFAVFVLLGLAGTARAADIVGDWDWGAGAGHTVIRADGTGADDRGNTMTWSQVDAEKRTYRLVWSHGFTDIATLSAGGNVLDVVNNVGTRFTCTRRAPAEADAPFADLQRSVDVAIAGHWKWGTGASEVEINADGTGSNDRGGAMTWAVKDAAARVYELRWNNGYTDTATLSADGDHLDIVNNAGTRFGADRIKSPAPGNAVNLTGSWTNGLLHIWQDGDRIVVTAAWRRPDGKAVCWFGEGTIDGHTAQLTGRYAEAAAGTGAVWTAVLTVSADGNEISAVYTAKNGTATDRRRYVRDK